MSLDDQELDVSSNKYKKHSDIETKSDVNKNKLVYSDDESTGAEYKETKISYRRKSGLDRARSSSVHDILSASQSPSTSCTNVNNENSTGQCSPKLILVRSLEDGYTLSNIIQTSPNLPRTNENKYSNSTDPNLCNLSIKEHHSTSQTLTTRPSLKSAKSESFLDRLEKPVKKECGHWSSSKVIYYWKENISTTEVKDLFFNIVSNKNILKIFINL